MLTAIESSSEILPGYVLVDRLGSGGYAEVWRASAPGGLFKAIKIVHGFYDEELASQEMKAMERIKDVRHPFLLSLERFDVVDGRLVILTELADRSLEQRAAECRAEGLPGIPRDELIAYLDDAAEALDYLIEKRSLLHLDVKPENLLILGEHLKVADFGLVKELASRTQNSMIAGMTPTFAAPEMFDDHPSDRSDQYSLAIVYQLMLTGTLPFTGRTAAQLAKQHTLSPPQLTPLPPGDRDIVARALAKVPEQRFPSCRAMIAALREGGKGKVAPPKVAATGPSPTMPKEASNTASAETGRAADDATQPRGPVPQVRMTQSFKRQDPVERSVTERLPREVRLATLREERIEDVASPPLPEPPAELSPTLMIAVGGVATRLMARAHELHAGLKDVVASGPVAHLAIDTDRQDLKKCCAAGEHPLSIDNALHLPLRLPKEYDGLRKQLDWLSRRWLYNIPRSLETRGYRPLGRLALLDHLDKVVRAIESKLRQLTGELPASEDSSAKQRVDVVLLAGMGGGTGGGTVVDLACVARHVAARLDIEVTINGVLLGSPVVGTSASGLATANMFALLAELRQVMHQGNRGVLSEGGKEHPMESASPPFDAVYVVAHPGGTDAAPALAQLENVARYLAWSHRHPLQAWVRERRQEKGPQEEPLSLRTLAFASLSQSLDSRQQAAARQLHREVWHWWLADSERLNWSQPVAPPRDPTGERSNEGVPPPSREEGLRGRFGDRATTRFAQQAVEELVGLWPSDPDSGSEDPRVVASVKRLTAMAEMRTESPHEPTPLERIASADEMEEMACRVLHQLLAMPQWNTYDPAQGLRALEEILKGACGRLVAEKGAVDHRAGVAEEGLELASGAVLTCGFARRTLAVLPDGPLYDGIARSMAEVRPTTQVVRGNHCEGWIAVEGSGVASQSLAVRLAHIHPDIAEAASRLHARSDIEWANPLVLREPKSEVADA